jgi:hypothetical protein
MENQVYKNLRLYPQTQSLREALLKSWIKDALDDVRGYINYLPEEILPPSCSSIILDLVLIRINKLGAEGIVSTSQSGVSETYSNGMPVDIRRRLNRLRRVR